MISFVILKPSSKYNSHLLTEEHTNIGTTSIDLQKHNTIDESLEKKNMRTKAVSA